MSSGHASASERVHQTRELSDIEEYYYSPQNACVRHGN